MVYEIERLKIRIDDLTTHMTASVTALQRISEILQEVLAVEDSSISLQNIGCPGLVLLPLKDVGITTVAQVIQRIENELLGIRNFGRTKMNILHQRLVAHGYSVKAEWAATLTLFIEKVKMAFVERLHRVNINITLEEHVAIREAARIAELTMNEYMRRVLLPQAQLDAGDISQILEEIHKRRAEERAKQPPSTWGGLPPELE